MEFCDKLVAKKLQKPIHDKHSDVWAQTSNVCKHRFALTILENLYRSKLSRFNYSGFLTRNFQHINDLYDLTLSLSRVKLMSPLNWRLELFTVSV